MRFALPGWQLTLAEVRGATDSPRFTHLIEAVPTDDGSPGLIDELLTSLFHLLGFVAGHEVGLGAVCGLDADGAVAWVHWSASRQRPGRPGVRWCSPMEVATALPKISGGSGVSKPTRTCGRCTGGLSGTCTQRAVRKYSTFGYPLHARESSSWLGRFFRAKGGRAQRRSAFVGSPRAQRRGCCFAR